MDVSSAVSEMYVIILKKSFCTLKLPNQSQCTCDPVSCINECEWCGEIKGFPLPWCRYVNYKYLHRWFLRFFAAFSYKGFEAEKYSVNCALMVFSVSGFWQKHWLFSLPSSMYLKLASFKLILVGNWEDSDLDMIIVQSSLRMHRVPVQDPISKDAEVPFSQPLASTDSTYAHRGQTVYLLKRKTTYKWSCAFQTCVVQGSGV